MKVTSFWGRFDGGAIGLSPLLVAIALIIGVSCSVVSAGFPWGLCAGDVTEEQAVLWSRSDQAGSIRVQVAADSGFATLVAQIETEARAEDDLTVKVDVAELTPGTRYFYRFVDLDRPGVFSETGRFRTAPATNQRVDFRLAVSGDSDFAWEPFHVLNDAADMEPDLFLWFGDTVYTDVPSGGLGVARTLAEYRAKYTQNRTDPNLRRLLAETAVWVGWDDHEVANDYSGGDTASGLSRERIERGYRAFFEHMPIRPAGEPADPFRTYRSFRYGALAEFFLVDGRQYRDRTAQEACEDAFDPYNIGGLGSSVNEACIGVLQAPRRYLGAEQLAWLKNALGSSTAVHKLVLIDQPMSFIGVLPYDRWDGYDAERKDILEFIDANRIEDVWMLSTDVHANAFNPDLGSYFRKHRPDYQLANGVIVRELVVGPIATTTFRIASLEFAANILGPVAESPLVQLLLTLTFSNVTDRLEQLNDLAFLDPDRFAYAILDISAENSVTVRVRGYPSLKQAAEPPTIETAFDSATVPPPFPCGIFPVLLLALFAGPFSKAFRSRMPEGGTRKNCAT